MVANNFAVFVVCVCVHLCFLINNIQRFLSLLVKRIFFLHEYMYPERFGIMIPWEKRIEEDDVDVVDNKYNKMRASVLFVALSNGSNKRVRRKCER